MLNSIGLQNPGIEAFLEQSLPRLRELARPLWVSVGGFSAADYAAVCKRLEESADVVTIELNLSCPNVEEAPETAAELVSAARETTCKPLYAKLSPGSDVAETARAVADAGADGLSLVNTIRGLALEPGLRAPTIARGPGGYSGPALRPVALAAVYACASAVELPIVGMGGIASGRDALEFLAAGATVVSLGTVLFTDPFAAVRVRAEMDREAASLGYASAAEVRGAAHGSAASAHVSAV
jgi:dihydroorotate dehydrogenase (NAD+) catalytic subunit